ncbi:ABC transporter permease [Roseibacillus ishigakijimensis]|uniref:ABC transporter permease n=1 Tax=Roseibacillus ishigakijimensis TaxID=454146 RepID=A0A934RR27_9BACT|nr:ABC transporter permease [Roseibacillus ishigakijimensis]MBK1833499.1 ABC transporter permease [Roseibacillus ishigakijimensis]
MTGIPYLTWRYLCHRPFRTLLLIFTVSLMIYLPLAVQLFVKESARLMQARAQTSPLLVGPRGSATDLALSSLYFTPNSLPPLDFLSFRKTQALRLGTVVPLHLRFRAGSAPIVGTSLAYFEQRALTPASGRLFTRLGDCVLGAAVAEKRGLSVGDSLISSPENVFDLAGVYPLKMRITGILAPARSPDDEAVFVDLKTAWVIEGLAHGHEDLSQPAAADAVLSREGDTIRANASVREYNEVTDENVDSFHFHGNQLDFPLSSLLLFPSSPKARALLQGKFDDPDSDQQIIVPADSLAQLRETLFATRKLVFTGFLALSAACALLVLLVFTLSLRLREGEMKTYRKIGLSPGGLLLLKGADLLVIILTGSLTAFLALLLTRQFAADLLTSLL